MSGGHAIRFPGTLLDELKTHDYTNDERFNTTTKSRGKKRNAKGQMSRKEARKQQRREKKDKVNHKSNTKASKPKDKQTEKPDLPFSSDDELSASDFEGHEVPSDGDDEEPMDAEETMKALKEAKASKKESKRSKQHDRPPVTSAEREAIERDEMEMAYYAKKLGLRGKNKKIHARDEFDAVGGLLEGLDFFENFENGERSDQDESGSEEDEDESEDDSEEEEEEQDGQSNDEEEEEESLSEEDDGQKLFSSDDDLSSGDFDDEDEPLDEEDESDEMEHKSSKKKVKENPYVAPAQNDGAYVPPFLRKQQLGDQEESEEFTKLRKTVKSSLNKLSDSNITTIISSLNDLFDANARQYATDAITKEILAIICQNNKLLDGFIMNYAAVAFSLWKLRGTEVGALFIQAFVETFLKYYDQQLETIRNTKKKSEDPSVFPKECSNMITLLSYCYNFGFVSSKLVYDLIRFFVQDPNEFTTELLLRIISISGPLIRGDDPFALKEIISDLLANVKSIKDQPVRLRFLLETISDLKNNRLKPSMLATSNQQLKKILQNVLKISNSSTEPLQVTVDDIKNVETKGKWWLVGASWKGNMANAFEEAHSGQPGKMTSADDEINLEDDLLDDIPNWEAIAKQQRMNTDVRRAIFVSIMSAQDYMDAFTRLEKLNLKNKQLVEIPRVIIHCLVQDSTENGYNAYYALLTRKLCEYQHHLAKSFQFLFWDIIKKFEEDSIDEEDDYGDLKEDARLRSIASRGKFFGSLISERILPLDIFKHVPIMSGLNADGYSFMEVLLYQLFVNIAKKSEVKSRDNKGNKIVSYKNDGFRKLLEDSVKLENRSVILKGLKWFVTKKFRYKDYFNGSKGNKGDEKELRRIEWAVPTFVNILDQELEGIDY
ncbi:hypothetical protein ZYGR_0A05330 [Zygosaccharomyces rouxii]|uniref:ZYRO0A12320p n=2 Tax=Zygosaccharomyces rouxii TaxID=4956 RepID=C5DNX1_ZYGRC|nr:uncharacterized protein ZYRO0A12320g [Zygosaccharomyces rouxii]KAH9198514.1 hypothetical protein LQ764DRAFT_235533 [Zygosaccharomyces rouxii]GAV46935.1 hypothetical protein ZYGR_0A05330 [Zygosaccharomyces rouxii]CAR25962.1 ZYRO0A12320p [Zygosaccharomyces rouxii]